MNGDVLLAILCKALHNRSDLLLHEIANCHNILVEGRSDSKCISVGSWHVPFALGSYMTDRGVTGPGRTILTGKVGPTRACASEGVRLIESNPNVPTASDGR